MDVESLQKSRRRRVGCLDVFVVMSIVFLFVAVAALAAGGAMVVMELRSKPLSFDKLTGDMPNPTYKMQNFVYLEAKSMALTTSTMHWAPVQYAEGMTVGSNFLFDSEQNSLQLKKSGTYFIYIDLKLTCIFNCDAGLLSVSIDDKLTCEVALPALADSTPVSRKCWTVTWLDKQTSLLTQMTVPKTGLENWRLELDNSRWGMFLVD